MASLVVNSAVLKPSLSQNWLFPAKMRFSGLEIIFSFLWSSNRTVTDSKEIPVFAKWHDGQEGALGTGS